MNSKIKTQEQISAMADGEISVEQLDEALAALGSKDVQDDWTLYHQIGDLLRSEDMNVQLSKDFSARMWARLETEPTIIAPAAKSIAPAPTPDSVTCTGKETRSLPAPARRWALPGMAAAAAMAAVAFVTTPQLLVAFKDAPADKSPGVSMAGNPAASHANGGAAQETVIAASASGELVVRDPRIDDYLLAHQRYSPSVYSTAQFARSATFATESNK